MMRHQLSILLIFFIAGCLPATAQENLSFVSGTIRDANGNPVKGVTVFADHRQEHAVVTDENGHYKLTLPPGAWKIIFRHVGYAGQSKNIHLEESEEKKQDIIFDTDIKQLEEVAVVGKSALKQVKELAYNVDVVNAKSLHNTTLDLAGTLDRISGIRVRSAGGLGSNTSFSMNGFTGNQVKFFIDGVPMDVFGSTFQINNIPVNIADRIELYKGVAPVSLGADALGGVVNIITTQNKGSWLDASYSYGSFNTHKTYINAGYTGNNGFTASVNLFQNYSDNDYWVDARILNLQTSMYEPGTARVRRFHDAYHNETIIAKAGVVNKSYADQLLLGLNTGNERSQDQAGTQMQFVYGQRHRKANTVTPFLVYSKKNLFIKGLDIRLTANYNFGYSRFIDTAKVRYNWLGQSAPKLSPGEFRYSSAKYYNNDANITFNADYKLSDRHSFSLSNILSLFNRKGKDPFNYSEESHMIGAPKKNTKNITGLAYRFAYNDSWNTSMFIKNYVQTNKGPFNTSTGANPRTYEMRQHSYSLIGYGVASTYFLKKFQFKASYEKTYRLPSTTEIFGDESFNAGNVNLRPESSNNYNLNIIYDASVNSDNQMEVSIGGLFRRTKDYIIRTVGGTAQAPATFANQGLVHNKGINAEVKYFYKKLLNAGVSFTFQDLRFKNKYEPGDSGDKVSLYYNTRVPNTPYVFGNGYITCTFRNVPGKNTLSVGYNTLYVHKFPLYTYVSNARDFAVIPSQFTHSVTVTYSITSAGISLSAEGWNITDEKVYDDFSLQKPGRSFSFKIRYVLPGKTIKNKSHV
ncbi:MAG: TonB-dependent receptor [Chitinophagaceae bacterium]|nr:TonB-dependent receptor [Chitinophagaceae bacterium]